MAKTFNDIRRLKEFEKDFKKLSKRFKTLGDDLNVFIDKQLKLYHKLGVDNNGIIPIAGLGISSPKIYKAKKFACKSLKGRGATTGVRVIYAYDEEKDMIELVEIYFKGDKENEDKARILKYYGR
jgi:mRNA-degrading endonuclease RelE of RelBE toxin-antitoxin system